LSVPFPLDVVLEAEEALLSVDLVSIQVDHVLLEVGVKAALFDESNEVLEPLHVLCRILLCFVLDKLDDSFGQEVLELCHERAVLEGLTGDVQRDVLAIHNTLHETQEVREEDVLAILFDENLLGVETDLSLFLGEAEALAVILRDVEDGLEIQRDIRVEMQLVLILFPTVG
jgi:hypothetical protein